MVFFILFSWWIQILITDFHCLEKWYLPYWFVLFGLRVPSRARPPTNAPVYSVYYSIYNNGFPKHHHRKHNEHTRSVPKTIKMRLIWISEREAQSGSERTGCRIHYCLFCWLVPIELESTGHYVNYVLWIAYFILMVTSGWLTNWVAYRKLAK